VGLIAAAAVTFVDALASIADSDPRGEARERRQSLQTRLDVAQINLCFQKSDFVAERGLVHVDVPGSWSAIGPIRPPIAAALQRILELERRLFGPDADGLLSCGLEQDGERRRAGRPQVEV
jgi:hypothetical protein